MFEKGISQALGFNSGNVEFDLNQQNGLLTLICVLNLIEKFDNLYDRVKDESFRFVGNLLF